MRYRAGGSDCPGALPRLKYNIILIMFKDRLEIILRKISEAHDRAHAPCDSPVSLIAVSKAHPPAALKEAFLAGIRLFGENRVQEARAKISELPDACRWHFLGHLQRNKIRQALPLFELIHGVDSLAIAKDIDRVAREMGLYPRILLETNIAGESTKFGFPPQQLEEQMEALLQLPRLQIAGLMTIPPPAPEPEQSRKHFAGLRELRDRLQSKFQVQLPELSMGMSDDFAVAVEEGATMVRVGTALFGERAAKTWRPEGSESLDE